MNENYEPQILLDDMQALIASDEEVLVKLKNIALKRELKAARDEIAKLSGKSAEDNGTSEQLVPEKATTKAK